MHRKAIGSLPWCSSVKIIEILCPRLLSFMDALRCIGNSVTAFLTALVSLIPCFSRNSCNLDWQEVWDPTDNPVSSQLKLDRTESENNNLRILLYKITSHSTQLTPSFDAWSLKYHKQLSSAHTGFQASSCKPHSAEVPSWSTHIQKHTTCYCSCQHNCNLTAWPSFDGAHRWVPKELLFRDHLPLVRGSYYSLRRVTETKVQNNSLKSSAWHGFFKTRNWNLL